MSYIKGLAMNLTLANTEIIPLVAEEERRSNVLEFVMRFESYIGTVPLPIAILFNYYICAMTYSQ